MCVLQVRASRWSSLYQLASRPELPPVGLRVSIPSRLRQQRDWRAMSRQPGAMLKVTAPRRLQPPPQTQSGH